MLHSLVKLPEQLNARTKVVLKQIDNSGQAMSGETRLSFRTRTWIYNFLNHPTQIWSYLFHLSCATALLLNLKIIMFDSISTWKNNDWSHTKDFNFKFKILYQNFLFINFIVEFFLRFWCSKAHLSYSKLSSTNWIFEYFCRLAHLFDLFLSICCLMSIVCFVWNLPFNFTYDIFVLITLRGLHRLFNVIQWVGFQSRESPWIILIKVFSDGGHLLLAMFYLIFLFIFLVAYCVYLSETHATEDDLRNSTKIQNLMDSIYVTSITLITIGYGDFSPVTYIGKMIFSISILIALIIFAIPSGLFATSVALKISEQEKCRKRKIRLTLAAILLQRTWRFILRKKQFKIVQELVQMRQCGQDKNLPIKTDKTLWKEMEYVMNNRRHFYVAQFIQLLSLNIARKKFRNFISTNDSSSTMKTYWKNNKETLKILNKINQQLKELVSVEQSWKENAQLNKLEEKIKIMEKQLVEQNKALKSFVKQSV